MGEYWCQVQFGSHSDHTVRLRAVYNLASSSLRESRARWIEKARTENKTGGNWGEEGLLYPFSNLFPFPAPSTFRVPFTFGISPPSESLEQIQTRGWGEVLNLVWERFFFPSLLTTLIDFPTLFGANIGTLAPLRTFLYCFWVHPSHPRLKIQLDGLHILRQMGTSTLGCSGGSGGSWENLIEPFLPFQKLGFAMSGNRSLRIKLGNETGVSNWKSAFSYVLIPAVDAGY